MEILIDFYRISPPIRAAIRVTTALLLGLFAVNAWEAFQETWKLTYLLLLVAETLTVVVYLSAHPPQRVNEKLLPAAAAYAATFYFLLIDLRDGHAIAPITVCEGLQVLGITFQIFAKLSLGRNFGLVPADRGIVTTGAYRIVRHPIYLAYFIAHAGFLLSIWSVRNCCVYIALFVLQAIRIVNEERLLARNSEYVAYCDVVKFRVLPFIF